MEVSIAYQLQKAKERIATVEAQLAAAVVVEALEDLAKEARKESVTDNERVEEVDNIIAQHHTCVKLDWSDEQVLISHIHDLRAQLDAEKERVMELEDGLTPYVKAGHGSFKVTLDDMAEAKRLPTKEE